MKVESLNDTHIDILREIGNIGAGNATTALSKMLNKQVDMNVPEVKIMDFGEVASTLGGEETKVVGILLKLSGDIDGMMMFVLEFNAAKKLINILTGDQGKTSDLNDLEHSAMQEIGNILTGSYLTSLSSLTNLTIKPSVPNLTIDMAGAVLSVPAIEFGKVGDKVLFIETGFKEAENDVTGYYILIPDVPSFKILLESLGVTI